MSIEQTIIELEHEWANVIVERNVERAAEILADDYRLVIGVEGAPLQSMPRERWLGALPLYHIHSFSIDEIQVRVYNDVAVAIMLWTQNATVNGRDRSGQFIITDIWRRHGDIWRVEERHSSRPEPPVVARPE